MHTPFRITITALLCAGWAAGATWGEWRLWQYESAAGASARPPATCPAAVRGSGESHVCSLVVLIHPKCPCSRATIGELARLMADCNGKLTATVLMIRPASVPEGWEKTDLWRAAASIPGVNVVVDEDGARSKQLDGATSGQAILYAADGRLLFSGGITESRGHSGDSAGRSAILELVMGSAHLVPGRASSTPVYGCPLFREPGRSPQ